MQEEDDMKTHYLSIAARTIVLISVPLLILTLAYGLARAGGSPEWVNFFSSNTTFLGQPVPVGAVIAAFDPQGVKCGQCTVEVEGKYGVLSCYRDDDTTPEDDGANPGDVISFTINGLPAVAMGPDDPIWTSNGDLWEVDLHVVAPPPPPVPVGGYIVPVNKLELLAPWPGLAALMAVVAAAVVVGRRIR